MMRLEDYLQRNAQQWPDKVAVVCGGECLTYAQLYAGARRRADELTSGGMGRVHVFRASQDTQFLTTYFGTHMAGSVAVPLEHDVPEERFTQIKSLAEGSPIPDEVADILFTTGTTGMSKGVMISHQTIVANAENLIDAQGFHHDLVFVICGPLNHIGSLSKLYPVILTGGTVIVLPGMKDLDAFFQAFDYPCQRMATFLVPANIRILLQFSRERLNALADKIEFIETGAAPISQSDMQLLCDTLPNSRLFNTYASTETGIIATYNFNDGQCVAGCLGPHMKHSAIHILEGGQIACSGITLMTGYVGDEEKTLSVKHDGMLFTSDKGYLDEAGMLHLDGRIDDVINVGGFKVSPVEVEGCVMSLPGIADCVCISAPHPVLGRSLKLLYVLSPGAKLSPRDIALHLKPRLESYKVPTMYEAVEAVCRTYNGKINRKAYVL